MFIIVSQLVSSGQYELSDVYSLMEPAIAMYYENSILILAIAAALTIPALCLFRRMDTRYEYKMGIHVTYDKPKYWVFIVCIVLGFFVGLSGNNLIILSGLSNLISSKAEQMIDVYSNSVALDLVTAGLLVPVCEEMIFRWLIFRRMRRNTPLTGAVIFSALLFACYHGNLVQGIYAFLVGAVFAIVMEKTQTVLVPVIVHIGANLFSVLATDLGLLDFIYENTTVLLISTVVSMIIVVLLLNLIFTRGTVDVLIPASEPSRSEREPQDL